MNVSLLIVVLSIICPAWMYTSRELRCVVCKATVKEINNVVQSQNAAKTVDVGGYQIDGKGNRKQQKKPLIQSEVYLSEVLDNVCEKMNDYVRATDKETGKKLLPTYLPTYLPT